MEKNIIKGLLLLLILFLLPGTAGQVFAASESGTCTITVTARPGGKIIYNSQEITGTRLIELELGSTPEFGFFADSGKYLSDIVLDSSSLGALDSSSYTFSALKKDHEIIAVFKDGDSAPSIPAAAGDIQMYIPKTSYSDFSESYVQTISKGVSFTSPVVSSNPANTTQDGDSVYMTFFIPVESGPWKGNLKKYGLAYIERSECSRTGEELTVVDKNGDAAVDCDGNYLETSVSYWGITGDGGDGGDAGKGGAGRRLLERVPDVENVTKYDDYFTWRNLKTVNSAGDIVTFDKTNVSNDELDVETDVKRYNVINYMYGYKALSEDSSGTPKANRDWVLGDIIHSEPEIIDYPDPDTGNLEYRYIAVSGNDGMIHVFTDTSVTWKDKMFLPGDEIFAFIPRDLLPRLKEIPASTSQVYMLDGSPSLYVNDTKEDDKKYYEKVLVFGQRRGGRSYWALDVTDPDPSAWSVKWHITGSTSSDDLKIPGKTQVISELGYTWSKPYFTTLKTGSSSSEDVVIFSGGYDELEDGFPEPFDDSDLYDGIRNSTEKYSVTVGGSEGYDTFNPGKDNYGRGIFVRKVSDGTELFSIVYNPTLNDSKGNTQASPDMKYCFPADISVIPFSESSLVMYSADIYGQIWKISFDYDADTKHPFYSDFSTRWKVKRIFTANPASSVAPGSASSLSDPFTDEDDSTPSLDITDQGRKTFYSPDVSYYGNEWTDKPVLYFGTGDRAHPRYAMVSNRFYAVSDTDSLLDETDLLNLTCDELDTDADSDNDGQADDAADDDALRYELKSLFTNNKVEGFYRMMDRQGECSDALSHNHKGEKILAQPTLYGGVVYFSSYQPLFTDVSAPYGYAYVYAIDYSYGTAALNYSTDEVDFDQRLLEDTYYKIDETTIPSDMKTVVKDGDTSGFINAGGDLKGVGEEGDMDLSDKTGGIFQMLWEIK